MREMHVNIERLIRRISLRRIHRIEDGAPSGNVDFGACEIRRNTPIQAGSPLVGGEQRAVARHVAVSWGRCPAGRVRQVGMYVDGPWRDDGEREKEC